MPGNSGPMVLRKRGWKGLQRLVFGKIRSALPKYKLVVLLSTAYVLFSFFIRMAGRFGRSQTLRSFRGELVDFLKHKESVYKTDIESFLQNLKGWEERISPQSATRMLEEKISVLKDDRRVSELYFHLSNAYYLTGDYKKYSSSFCLGLEKLRDLRKNTPLDRLGVKFLFTEDWGWGIGHITWLDPLVKLRELGLLSPQERVLVLSPEDGANKHYLRYWNKHLEFLMVSKHEARQLLAIMQPITEKLSGFELKTGFSMLYEASNLAGTLWQQEKREPLLKLDAIDSRRGWEILEKWGMSPGDWFVTLHVREYNPYTPNHVRVRAAPNADIYTYIPAIQAIIDQGGRVIRIGDPSMSELPKIDGLIDYANSIYKCDWMDVFLCASCKFFIGTSSGPVTLPPSFGVPVLYTNCCGIGFSPPLGRALVIPKLFLSRKENRLLSFREILASPIGWTVRVPEDDNIELRDNSPDEIQSATEEMLGLLDEGDMAFDRRSELQSTFDQLRRKYGNHASTPIANSFAKKHRNIIVEAD